MNIIFRIWILLLMGFSPIAFSANSTLLDQMLDAEVDYAQQSASASANTNTTLGITVSAGPYLFVLNLQPSNILTDTKRYDFQTDTWVAMQSQVQLYQGTVSNEPDSWARITAHANGSVTGMIKSASGIFSIDHKWHYDDNAAASDIVLYEIQDVAQASGTFTDGEIIIEGALSAAAYSKPELDESIVNEERIFYVDVAIDHQFSLKSGGDEATEAAFLDWLNRVNGIYQLDFNLTVLLDEFILYPTDTDPFLETDDGNALLREVGNRYQGTWPNSPFSSKNGAALVYTGTDFNFTDQDGNTSAAAVAIAPTNGLCDSRFSAAVFEYNNSFDAAQTVVLAHEMGHLLGSKHDNDESNKDRREPIDLINPVFYIMQSTLNASFTERFSHVSRADIVPNLPTKSCIHAKPRISFVSITLNSTSVNVSGPVVDEDNDALVVGMQFDGTGNWMTAQVAEIFPDVTGFMFSNVPLSQGEHFVNLRVVDAQNQQTTFKTVYFTVTDYNQNKPSVDVINTDSGVKTATVSGQASDIDGDLDFVDVEFDNNGKWIRAQGTYSWTVSQPLASGNHSARAIGTDSNGNTSVVADSASFYVNANPYIDAYNIDVNIIGQTMTVSGTASDEDGDLSFVFLKTGMNFVMCDGTTNWTCSFDLSSWSPGIYAEGSINIEAVDSLDNRSGDAPVFEFILQPACNEATATLDNHVAADRAYTELSTWFIFTNTHYFASGSGEELGTNNGQSTVTLTSDGQTWQLGNCGGGNSESGLTRPSILSYSVSVQGSSVTISGSGIDLDDDIVNVIALVGAQGISAPGSNDWSITLNNLQAGNYGIHIFLQDAAGHYSRPSDQITFVIDEPSSSNCFTSSNADHVSAGRGYTETTWWWLTYYANGSSDNLGTSASEINSLIESSADYWEFATSCP